MESLSRARLSVTPWTSLPDSSSMGFSRQAYWSGQPFPSQGISSAQGLNLGVPHCRQTLYFLSRQGSLVHREPQLIKEKIPEGILWILRAECCHHSMNSDSVVKNMPVMQETRIPSLGQEDSLEKGKATHSSILAWRIPRTEKPGRLQSMGSQRVGYD